MNLVSPFLRLDNFKDEHQDTVQSFIQTIFEQFRPEACRPALLKSVLYLLENFGKMHKPSPYILQDIFESDRSSWDADLYSDLMAAGFSLFCCYPAVMQPILSNILHTTFKVRNHHLHTKVLAFYSLLKLMA